MESDENNSEDIDIRLRLSKKEDQPLYDFFIKMKKNLGVKQNTEITRICIKKAYEYWFLPNRNKE